MGVQFDAVRVIGASGDEVAYGLMQFTGFRAGPIVRSGAGGGSMCFLLPPRSGAALRWPIGARLIGGEMPCDAFVGIPALGGRTWPLDWCSRPTGEAPFVDAELLYEVAVAVLAGRTGP
ncbi:hypothetical protein ABZ172_20585 [Streptomyces sp. NPDC006296]|uniref:hypothetical protein n=1 Tax=Streptomyces sp. NPDC006296 TaxID=3156746 RepID=UPI0033B6DC6C